MKINLGKRELIHFIGIGGIGMSGLALIMKGKGFKVQGSDIANNKNIERYLHRRGEPFRSIDFDKLLQKKKKDDQLNLFNNECERMCGV